MNCEEVGPEVALRAASSRLRQETRSTRSRIPGICMIFLYFVEHMCRFVFPTFACFTMDCFKAVLNAALQPPNLYLQKTRARGTMQALLLSGLSLAYIKFYYSPEEKERLLLHPRPRMYLNKQINLLRSTTTRAPLPARRPAPLSPPWPNGSL